MDDTISRQAEIEAIDEIINRFEQILRDIRETKVDDSVCGMCAYDGAYVGESGDWCNERPGFDKDDCFKLSDECRKRWLKSVDLPSAQPSSSCNHEKDVQPGQEEPFEKCSDCIHAHDSEDICVLRRCKHAIAETVECFEPKQPERKRGKQIYGEDEYGIDGYHCDKCGFFVPWDYAHKFINYIEDYNFCPNCGAEMSKE